jgi:hypothetical protein
MPEITNQKVLLLAIAADIQDALPAQVFFPEGSSYIIYVSAQIDHLNMCSIYV